MVVRMVVVVVMMLPFVLLPDAADVMVMADLWLAHRLLEAWESYPVLAQLTVHVRTASDRLLGTLGEGVEQQRMDVEIAGAQELGVGMQPAEFLSLLAN